MSSVVIVEIAGKGQDDQQISRQGFPGSCFVWSRPRSASQERFGRSGRRFRHALGGRRQGRQAPVRYRPGGEGCRRRVILATDPDREGEAISWALCWRVLNNKKALKRQDLSSASCSTPLLKSAILEAMRHPSPGRYRPGERLSGPRARSIISLASTFRPYFGGNCPVPARPAAFNLSPCDLSASANSKSKNSSLANTGRSQLT